MLGSSFWRLMWVWGQMSKTICCCCRTRVSLNIWKLSKFNFELINGRTFNQKNESDCDNLLANRSRSNSVNFERYNNSFLDVIDYNELQNVIMFLNSLAQKLKGEFIDYIEINIKRLFCCLNNMASEPIRILGNFF